MNEINVQSVMRRFNILENLLIDLDTSRWMIVLALLLLIAYKFQLCKLHKRENQDKKKEFEYCWTKSKSDKTLMYFLGPSLG